MKGLFKRLSILAASLAMVFGVGLVNNEKKNAKAIGESTYVKVTEAPTDWTGEYVLVYENSATEAYVWTGADATNCYEKATIAESKITLSPTAKLNIASMDGGYSIQINGGTNNGKYVGQASNSNGMKIQPTALANTLSITSNSATIVSGGAYMRFNASKDQMRFRYYKSASYTNQKTVQLYKLDESSIEKEVDSVEVTLKTSSTAYVDNSLTEDDIEVYVLYADATGEVIKNGYSINPELPYTFSSSDVGEITFIVTYKDVTASFTITVKEKPTDLVLSEIKITEGENVKKTYYIGDSVDTTGLTVTAGYLSESDPSHESYVDVTDKVTWSLDTSAINAEAHLTATYVEGEITETTYIIVAVVAAPTYVVDKLTAADLAAENNTYTDFRDVTATSGIKYAGNSAKDSSTYIQLRSNKDKNTGSYSGIVSTTANRILTKVEVEWASKTADARTIDVYGYNVAFNDASDLYNTKAEKLGTLKKTDTSLEIPTNTKYAYVGIRSTSGAIYLASISFTWDISSEANSFIDMWSQMRANGTNGICDYLNGSQDSSELDTLLEMYNDSSLIDAADKAIINDAADGENNTIGNSILYIAAYKAAHTSNNAGMNNAYHAVTNNISFILIISVIGLSSVLGYYFIQKRRLAK